MSRLESRPASVAACPLPLRRARGFTLIELMITVAVVAILAAIAIPAYQQYVMKSRRTAAKTAILELASREERYYTTHNTYSATAADLGYAALPADVPDSATPYYRLNVVTANGNTEYSVSAAPTGAQAADGCGTFTVNHLGIQGNTGNTTSTADCWK